MMELWATGFNAWGQLQTDVDLASNPQDFHTFKCILQNETIELLRTSSSAILIRTSEGLKVNGSPDDFIKVCIEDEKLPIAAIAGNGKVVPAFHDKALTEYASVAEYKASNGTVLRSFDRLKQVASNETAFTALSSTGTVYTWGDGRFEACLARQVSEQCQASTPCLVEDLLDLPTGKIRKVSSGGYTSAAITVGNDLYIWGGRPGQQKILEQLEGCPTPVDLEGLDILDVAVGNNHFLALTADHRLFVVGAGGNGQLGLGSELKELRDWKEVVLPLQEGQRIVGVNAGYNNSFVIVGL